MEYEVCGKVKAQDNMQHHTATTMVKGTYRCSNQKRHCWSCHRVQK